jgi:hypothetical protein
MFTLYRTTTNQIKSYAWVNPQGQCFTSRDVAPVGFTPVHGHDAFKGLSVKDLAGNGFKKVSTKMTQEQIAKGWLTN